VAVIDQAHQRLVLGRFGQQVQHRQADEEVVGRRPGSQAKGGRERVALRLGQPRKVVEHRGAELMERGEGQLHLRLHARDPDQPQVRGRPGHVVQQRALADPGLTADHDDAAPPRAELMQEPVEQLAFSLPVQERQGRAGERAEARQGRSSRCSLCQT
jgi:hypothetical protein